jgi:hypothetical protein
MHHAMKNPPLDSPTCCKRPLKGRIMPTIQCDSTALQRRDEWYIDEDEFKVLMDETKVTERAKHNVHSWDNKSCLQNGHTLITTTATTLKPTPRNSPAMTDQQLETLGVIFSHQSDSQIAKTESLVISVFTVAVLLAYRLSRGRRRRVHQTSQRCSPQRTN